MARYDDFWFVDKRNQSTNLKRWFLYAIILFVFVSIFTYLYVITMYKSIEKYQINVTGLTISVDEAKKTNVNGYIKGSIKNNKDEDLVNKFIKVEFYTKDNVNIGNEYVEIKILKGQESKTYEVKFRYQDVERFVITITDSNEEQ